MARHEEVIAAVRAGVESGTWTAVDRQTIRYTEERPFPRDHPMRSWPSSWGGRPPYRDWGPTFDRHLFVTVVGKSKILGVSGGPWTGRRDSPMTNTRTLEILKDPAAYWA